MDSLPVPLRTLVTRVSALDRPARLKLGSGLALAAALGLLIWGVFLRDRMVPLESQPEDPGLRSTLFDQMKADGIKVHIEPGTSKFLVPQSQKESIQTRYGVVLERSSPVGLELMDENDFGGTQMREHIRYVRGLQGEIERLLNSSVGVAGSKVLISLPRRALFEEDRIDPSASVRLDLIPGTDLSTTEGKRMARLIAAAVPGLTTDRVEIMDNGRRVLHASVEAEVASAGSGLADIQRGHERHYEQKISSMLDDLLGPGRSSVRVSVEVDHAERTLVQTDLDPDKVVTISSNATESESSDAGALGVAGTESNLAENRRPEGGRARTETTTHERANMEVPESTESESSAPGGILSRAAAVAVDGYYDPAAAAATEEGGAEAVAGAATRGTYRARTDEELAEIRSLVAAALGAPLEKVTVVSREFPEDVPTEAVGGMANVLQSRVLSDVARWSLALVALFLTYSMVLGPVVKRLTIDPAEQEDVADAELDGALELNAPHQAQSEAFDLEGWLERVATGDRFVTPAEVSTLVRADLDNAVATLQDWINIDQETLA